MVRVVRTKVEIEGRTYEETVVVEGEEPQPLAASETHYIGQGLNRVDGAEREFKYDRDWRSASLEITTPTIPYASRDIPEVQYWVERFDPSLGNWESGPLRPLI